MKRCVTSMECRSCWKDSKFPKQSPCNVNENPNRVCVCVHGHVTAPSLMASTVTFLCSARARGGGDPASPAADHICRVSHGKPTAPELAAWLQPEWAIAEAQDTLPKSQEALSVTSITFVTSKELKETQAIQKKCEPNQLPKQVYLCWTEPSSQAGLPITQGQDRTHMSPVLGMEFSCSFMDSNEPKAGILECIDSTPEDAEVREGMRL